MKGRGRAARAAGFVFQARGSWRSVPQVGALSDPFPFGFFWRSTTEIDVLKKVTVPFFILASLLEDLVKRFPPKPSWCLKKEPFRSSPKVALKGAAELPDPGSLFGAFSIGGLFGDHRSRCIFFRWAWSTVDGTGLDGCCSIYRHLCFQKATYVRLVLQTFASQRGAFGSYRSEVLGTCSKPAPPGSPEA